MPRLVGLTFLIIFSLVLIRYTNFDYSTAESSTIALGFLISSAYIVGQCIERLRLPKITGYILTGLIFGPYVLKFISKETLIDLNFINHMALALIAFYAGGELQITQLKAYRKSFSILIAFQFLIVVGVAGVLYLIRNSFYIFQNLNNLQILAFSTLLGVVSVARSPSTVIAIISETRSEGRVTDIVLGVTIALDVVVIMLFAIAISFCDVLLVTNKSWDFSFFFLLLLEIIISLLTGLALGIGLNFLIKRVDTILPIAILTIGFVVTKFSYALTDYLEHSHEIGLKIEPLLICITAGFYIQNFSNHNKRFMASLDKVSLVIYTLFFSLTGASLNLEILQKSWAIAFLIFILRTIMLAASTTAGALVAKDPSPQRYLYWLGFVSQAGVSLGFAHEIMRRFPVFGSELASIIIAVVAIDQLIGPITFKYALEISRETKEKLTYRTLVKQRTQRTEL